MLPKENRLTTKQWDVVYTNGRKIYTPSFVLIYYKTDSNTPNKIGVSVSKKNVHSASKRNAIKRTIMNSCDEWGREQKGLYVEVIVKNFENSQKFLEEMKNALSSLS